jgi:hypothetical protein
MINYNYYCKWFSGKYLILIYYMIYVILFILHNIIMCQFKIHNKNNGLDFYNHPNMDMVLKYTWHISLQVFISNCPSCCHWNLFSFFSWCLLKWSWHSHVSLNIVWRIAYDPYALSIYNLKLGFPTRSHG